MWRLFRYFGKYWKENLSSNACLRNIEKCTKFNGDLEIKPGHRNENKRLLLLGEKWSNQIRETFKGKNFYVNGY